VFTVLGLMAGLVIVLNLPEGFHDPEGFITCLMVLGPTGGGVVAGVVVGLIAAAVGGPPSPRKMP
jgi:hypothetical protein